MAAFRADSGCSREKTAILRISGIGPDGLVHRKGADVEVGGLGMNRVSTGKAAGEVAGLLRDGSASGLSDAELIAQFIGEAGQGGEVAFSILVARHGPMVLSVCRRILRDPCEADDAFQATFLVLARRAAAVRVDHSLGLWLSGVSRRVARRLQTVAMRRPALFSQPDDLRSIPGRTEVSPADVERRLDLATALDGLPAAFREALVLCYLEGLTHEEAARRLDCPVGTVRSRLARGRALLRDRLGEAGPVSQAGRADPASGDPSGAARAVPGPFLIHSTARAAARVATGGSLTGVVPARVVELTTGVIAMMYRTKLAAAGAFVLLAAVAVLGAWAGQPGSDRTGPPTAGMISSPQRRPDPQETPKSRPEKAGPELPPDFPAFVVATVPRLGEVDVDAATVKEIRVKFSKPMMDKSWSLTQGNVYAFPKSTGAIHYLDDQQTCVMPVKLEPGKTYVIGINGGRFNNFKEKNGKPSLPCTLAFKTQPAS